MRLSPLFLVLTLASLNAQPAQAISTCVLNVCRMGGPTDKCYAAMRREAAAIRKSCGQVELTTGYSSYAMATTLPGVCIRPEATLWMHRPYHKDYNVLRYGSRWHNFFFGNIRPTAVSYFVSHGGMKRNGMDNLYNMTPVPPQRTGLRICR